MRRRTDLVTLGVVMLTTAMVFPANAIDQLNWTQVDNAAPTARYFHAMAFDRDRNVLVLFGGNTGEADTWEWNTISGEWHLAAPQGAGPSRRGGHAMAYDPIRHVTVLTGGAYDGTVYGDVWEWNGVAWTQRAGAAQLPQPRFTHGMVFDAQQGKIALYGGTSTLPDAVKTLVYDGNTWTLVATGTHPAVQFNSAMAYDTARGVSVLATAELSGNSTRTFEYGFSGGVWNWVLRSFATPVPAGRSHPRMVYDESRHVCVFHGGTASSTWTYDGSVWTSFSSSGFSRTREALAYDPLHAEVLMYSGNFSDNGCECSAGRSMYAWGGSSWSPRWSAPAINPTYMAGIAFDEHRGRTVVYGGRQLNPSGYSGVTPSSQTWEWDGVSWAKIEPATVPGSRCDAPLVYDSNRHVTVMYGGLSNDSASSAKATTWEYDGVNWLQRPDGPGQRWRHGAAFDRSRNKLVLFGGMDQTATALGDTWEYDGVTWTQAAASGPTPRMGAMMAYDAAHARTVLFGGASGSTLYNDTWAWNGTAWTRLDVPSDVHPPTRQSAGFAYDADRGQIVMYAGRAGTGANRNVRDDVWILDGTQWIQLSASPAIGKAYSSLVYDSLRHRFVLVGGSSLGESSPNDGDYLTGQTWEAAYPSCSGDITGNGDVNVDDLFAVINGWGICPSQPSLCPADIVPAGGDGVVNIDDLFAVINAWGECR